MKENIFDVLMYLFENYMEDEIEILPDSEVVRTELEEAGFEQIEVNKAFEWLESLSVQGLTKPTEAPAFRIFCAQEQAKLDLDCRNLLIYLESIGILNSANREIVIDRAMALENEDISMEKLKWIVLMVLLSQPNEEIAFSRMEDFIYNLVPTYIH
jgi:Smg protein